MTTISKDRYLLLRIMQIIDHPHGTPVWVIGRIRELITDRFAEEERVTPAEQAVVNEVLS